MAITHSWGGLGVAPGTVITNTTVGTGDTAFNSVSGTAPVAQNALLRWPAIQYDQAPAAVSHLNWTFTGRNQFALRWLAQYSAAGAASVSLLQGLTVGAQEFRLEMAGTGGAPPAQLRLRNAVNTEVANSGGNAIPLGFPFYLETIFNLGVLRVNVYLVGVQTPAWSVQANVNNIGIDQLRIGNVVAANTQPRFWIDDVALSDTATPIPQVGAGSGDPSTYRPLVYNLNRVAGTIVNGVPTLDGNGAANRWAFTTGLDMVHALNVKAGNTLPAYKDLLGVCNQLAGTTGLGEQAASSRWAAG